MSKANRDRFSAEAADWDARPSVQKASSLAFEALKARYPDLHAQPPTLDIIEIGCGTGILSFKIAPHARSLTAVDIAEGMIDALKLKLTDAPHVRNILPVCAILEDPDDVRIRKDPLSNGETDPKDLPPRKFDLVISHLVLHHIPSLEGVLATMIGCLKPGGSVALTDFEDCGPHSRKFHAENRMEGVERHGIKRTEIKRLLDEAGFVDVKVETAFEMEKKIETIPGGGLDGTAIFPFLICMGKKPL